MFKSWRGVVASVLNGGTCPAPADGPNVIAPTPQYSATDTIDWRCASSFYSFEVNFLPIFCCNAYHTKWQRPARVLRRHSRACVQRIKYPGLLDFGRREQISSSVLKLLMDS
jgi:hypothetical protein